MQIPNQFKPFDKSTLIAVTDKTKARLFLAKDMFIDELDTITTDYIPLDNDKRQSTTSPSGVQIKEQSEHIKDNARDHLYSTLSKDLMLRMQKGDFVDLAITVPKEEINEIKEHLHIDLLKKTLVFVPKTLTKEDPIEIVAHIQEEMFEG